MNSSVTTIVGRDEPRRGKHYMYNYRTVQSIEPFPRTGQPENRQELDEGFHDDRHGHLPEGWRQLPTGLSGSRLYHIAPPDGGDAIWLAEVIVDRDVLRQSCSSELRARAWLAIWDKPRFAVSSS